MADGAYRWLGNAPAPDPERVEALHAGYEGEGAATFGGAAHAAAVECIDRALGAARAGDPTDAADELARVRAMVEALRPQALEPRRGLAGLFDSRGKRLKRFRETYRDAAARLTDSAAVLTGRIEAAGRRSDALDSAWAEVRDAVVDLDAHLAAAARRLTGHAPAEDGAAHPLEARKAALDACRLAALGSLPLIRGSQNADARTSEALRTCGAGLTAWRDDWRDALGLSGKRPRRVRPDGERLTRSRDQVLIQIDRALAELKSLATRRADVESRLTALRSQL